MLLNCPDGWFGNRCPWYGLVAAMIRLTAFLCLLSGPAFATNCADRDTVIDRLKSKFNERFVAGGISTTTNGKGNVLIEIWASEETGTFTIMLSQSNGMSCVVSVGTDWHQSAYEAEPKGVPG